MDESEIANFRLRFRLAVIEELVLKNAFGMNLLILRLSIDKASEALKESLDGYSALADRAYGQHFQDPALSALYADEVKEVIEDMKKAVDKMAATMKRTTET